MATTVARLEAVLGADTHGFDRAMDKSEGKMHGVRAAAGLAGAAIATGLGVVAKIGFDELRDSQKVTAQTEAALKSTGGAAHVTAKHIDEMANSILRKTGIDDEQIRSAENLLLTFRGIRNETGKGNKIFDQATKAVTDLSVAFHKDLSSSAILVGKALQDPVKGMSALRRVGVQLDSAQQSLVKDLIEGRKAADAIALTYTGSLSPAQSEAVVKMSKMHAGWREIADTLHLKFTPAQAKANDYMEAGGHTMAAQKIILGELKKETEGSAEAMGKTLSGQMNIAKETFKNLAAEIVSAALPAITAFAKIISQATLFLSEHQKIAKILFVALGALSVVLLTISASMKLAGAATQLWTAATKVATAAQWLLNVALTANPIGIVIVALAALGVAMVLAYTKIKFFREGVQEAWTWIKDHWPLILGIMAGPVGLAVEQIIVHRNRLVQVFANLPGMIAGVLGDLKAFFFHQIIDRFTGAIDDGVGAVKRAIRNLFGKVIDWVKDVLGINSPSAVFHEMGRQSVQGFVNGVGSMAGVLKNAVVGMVKSLPSKALGVAGDILGGGGEIKSAPGEHSVGSAEKYLVPWAQQEGITVTSIAGGNHVKGSYHYQHRAIDVDGGYAKNRDFFADSINHFGAKNITELFFDPMGYYIKNGKRIKGAIGGHGDHVHIALDKGGWLPTGTNLITNNTGRPERVLGPGEGGMVVINYNGTIIHEREAEQRIVDLLARAQRRGPLGLSGGFA